MEPVVQTVGGFVQDIAVVDIVKNTVDVSMLRTLSGVFSWRVLGVSEFWIPSTTSLIVQVLDLFRTF